MGKIEITSDIKGADSDNNTLEFNVEDCSENDIANVLRELFTMVIKNNLVRPGVLIHVIDDIIQEMFKSELGANYKRKVTNND